MEQELAKTEDGRRRIREAEDRIYADEEAKLGPGPSGKDKTEPETAEGIPTGDFVGGGILPKRVSTGEDVEGEEPQRKKPKADDVDEDLGGRFYSSAERFSLKRSDRSTSYEHAERGQAER